MLSLQDLNVAANTTTMRFQQNKRHQCTINEDVSITRLKKHHPKVRTGCLTCRKRRVKCDERHPGCSNCVKSGRNCEGYQVPKPWLFEPSKQLRSQEKEAATALQALSPIHLFDDNEDQRPYLYYIENTAPRLASYFNEMMASFLDDTSALGWICGQNHKFWYGLVPRTAFLNPAVKHSLLALSSLHEWTQISSVPLWQDAMFVKYYREAVCEISRSSRTASMEVVLIACVLFAHAEFLRGASAAGIAHIKAGLGIIHDQRQQCKMLGRTFPDVVTEEVEPILSGFGVKSEQYSLNHSEVGPHVMTDDKAYKLPDLPEAFQTLLQASMTLLQIVYWVHILMELGRPGHLTILHGRVLLQAEEWLDAFEKWRLAHGKDFHNWRSLILAQHQMCTSILKTQPQDNDVASSRATEDFRPMLTQLQSFMGVLDQPRAISKEPQLLQDHIGVISPVFFVATQSCSREVRHDALNLLQSLHVKEGRWNSCVAYVIARAMVDLEECDNPNEPQRIRVEGVEIKPNRKLELRYTEYSSKPKHKRVIHRKVIDQQYCSVEEQREWSLSRLTKVHGLQGSVHPTSLACSCLRLA